MAEIAQAVSHAAGDLEAEPTLRFAEFSASLLSWALLAAAHRGKYSGMYEYGNYTPLNFLLTMALLENIFVIVVVAVKRARLLERSLFDRFELVGSVATTFGVCCGFVAGAASSTQLHDEFGDSSICSPRYGSHTEKAKADYFCSRVDAAVAFAFFASVAAGLSLYLVLKARGFHGGFRPSTADGADDEEGLDGRPDAYNPIGREDGRTFDPPFGTGAMAGVGPGDVKHDAAVDL